MAKRIKIFYACTTALDHELGETDVRFFRSVSELKNERPCWKDCGISKIVLIKVKIVRPEKKDSAEGEG